MGSKPRVEGETRHVGGSQGDFPMQTVFAVVKSRGRGT